MAASSPVPARSAIEAIDSVPAARPTTPQRGLVRRELELVLVSAKGTFTSRTILERVLREIDRTLLLIGGGRPSRPRFSWRNSNRFG